MVTDLSKEILEEQMRILDAAAQVLSDSKNRLGLVFARAADNLSIEEKESCEALTARFSRLCDNLLQRAFRTLDKIELLDEGTGIDRLNRCEKRGIILSANLWKRLRDLKNTIAHEYLIEKSDQALKDSYDYSQELLDTVQRFKDYIFNKGYWCKFI